jgi:hypothetical protein
MLENSLLSDKYSIQNNQLLMQQLQQICWFVLIQQAEIIIL